MNKFNNIIDRLNFKKIFIGYVIITIILGILCSAAVGYVYKDKIGLALNYKTVSEKLKSGNTEIEAVKAELKKLAESSGDITDILLLDNKNNILYSANETKLAWDSEFELTNNPQKNRFLVSDKNSDVAFRFVKKDEFMLSAVFAEKFPEIKEEYDEDTFYLNNFQNKKVYMISFLRTGANGNKVYVISDPVSVPYGIPTLKASACIAMLLFMIYWIIIALWVYQNARKSRLYAPAWGIVTLFTNIGGVLIYVIYKNINGVCAFCGTVQSKTNLFCTHCGKKIGVSCPECGHAISFRDNFCPKCGHKTK